MRTLWKSGVTALLCVGLIFGTGMAAPSSSMGVVLQADHATLGTSEVAVGTAIFDGDNLQTNGSGSLRARLGQSQVYLLPDSGVLVHQLSKGFSASLSGGTVVLSSVGGETFQVLADGATIQPKSDQPTLAQVSCISPSELILSARHGDLLVSLGDETQTVSEGTSYRMMINPGTGLGPQGMFSAGRNRFVLILITAAAVGAGIATYLVLITNDTP